MHNKTFCIITSQGTYSLRVYNYKKSDQITFECALLQHLKGLPVPQLVKFGKKYTTMIDGKHAILYQYIPGKQLQSFTSHQLHAVGIFLARFHNRGKTFVWRKPRYKFYDLPDKKIMKFASIARKAHAPYLAYLPEIIKDLKANRLFPSLPEGPIHVDVKPENVLFYKGKLSGVLDFDNSYIGPYLLDLAKSMVWFGTKRKRFDIKAALHIYRGYSFVRKLTIKEHRELYKAIKFAFLSHVFVDYYMYAIRATTKKYFDFIVNELYVTYKAFTMDEEEFYSIFK